ncbi:MAG TPA: signal peptidase II [Patescibacteria group bacterium]|nr:signal peptidase II [Patescibacteria group bacterium]
MSLSPLVRKSLTYGLVIAAVVTLVDQMSKWSLLSALRPAGVTETPFAAFGAIRALPFVDFVLTWNRGVSFGMGNTNGPWNAIGFTLLALVIGAMLVNWMAQTTGRLQLLALGLVVGGALGNVIDRLRYGAVVDFLYFHVGAFNWWPAFNVADSAICVGAVLLIFDSLFAKRDSHKNTR